MSTTLATMTSIGTGEPGKVAVNELDRPTATSPTGLIKALGMGADAVINGAVPTLR